MATIDRIGYRYCASYLCNDRLFTLWHSVHGIDNYAVYELTHSEGESNDNLVFKGNYNGCVQFIKRHKNEV